MKKRQRKKNYKKSTKYFFGLRAQRVAPIIHIDFRNIEAKMMYLNTIGYPTQEQHNRMTKIINVKLNGR